LKTTATCFHLSFFAKTTPTSSNAYAMSSPAAPEQVDDYSLYSLMLLPIPKKIAERWPPADTGSLHKHPIVRLKVIEELKKGTSLDRFLSIVLGEYKSYLEMGAANNIPALEVMHGFAHLFGGAEMQHVVLIMWRFELLNRAQVSFLKKRWVGDEVPYKNADGVLDQAFIEELSEDYDELLTAFEAGSSTPPLPGDLRGIRNVPNDALLRHYRAIFQPIGSSSNDCSRLISCTTAREFYQHVLLKYMYFMQMPGCPTIEAITGMKSDFTVGPMRCFAWTHMVLAMWHMGLMTRKMVEHLTSFSFSLFGNGYRKDGDLIHPALEDLDANFKNLWAAWQAGKNTSSDVPMPVAIMEKKEEFAFIVNPELIVLQAQDPDFYLSIVYRQLRDSSSPVTFRQGLRTLLVYAELKCDALNNAKLAVAISDHTTAAEIQQLQTQHHDPLELLQKLYTQSIQLGYTHIEFWKHALLVLWSWGRTDASHVMLQLNNPYLLGHEDASSVPEKLRMLQFDFLELLRKFRAARSR
jgi:hypothetical protein